MSEATTVFPSGTEQQAPSSNQDTQLAQIHAPESTDNEALLHTAVTGLQEALVTEMSGLVGRLITTTVTEADTAVKRARAEGQKALDEVRAELEAQTREKEALAQAIQESKGEAARLRLELEAERDRANAARQECETLQSARARADAACQEADTIRRELVATYEAQIRTLQADIDAQASERAKLLGVLQAVQQTVAASAQGRGASHAQRSQSDASGDDEPVRGGRNQINRTAAGSAAPVSENEAAARSDVPTPGSANRADEVQGAARGLTLVPSNQQAPVDAPPELLQHVKQLLDEIEAMYWADVESAERPADVVERLTVNLRYAWDLFTRRTDSDGGTGAAVFGQQLSALIDAKAATSFGRHLSIAAHGIVARTQSDTAQHRAAAS